MRRSCKTLVNWNSRAITHFDYNFVEQSSNLLMIQSILLLVLLDLLLCIYIYRLSQNYTQNYTNYDTLMICSKPIKKNFYQILLAIFIYIK